MGEFSGRGFFAPAVQEGPKNLHSVEEKKALKERIRAVEKMVEDAEVARDDFSVSIVQIHEWFPGLKNDYEVSAKLEPVLQYLNSLCAHANEANELLLKAQAELQGLLKKQVPFGN